MEEISSLKRQREEETQVVEEKENVLKRQKSYKDIITLLEGEEDVPNEDLSSLISTLQEELSSSSSSGPHKGHDPARCEADPENPESGFGSREEEGESVMRHLLEASDDELGLPSNTCSSSITDGCDELGGQVDGGDFFFPVNLEGEGLWEFEDHEAADYYEMFQQSSEIFM